MSVTRAWQMGVVIGILGGCGASGRALSDAGGALDAGGTGDGAGTGDSTLIDDGTTDGLGGTTDTTSDIVTDTIATDTAAQPDAPSRGCPAGLPGPAFVQVAAPAGSAVTHYCIDATEVTNAQYAQFLAAGYPVSAQDPWCAWNTSYTPPSGWPAVGKDNYPVVYVWWCDAFAYCKWAGKHLCGRIGGGQNGYSAYADASASEWFNACSASGTRAYPYGNTFATTACNGIPRGLGNLVAAGSEPACVGGFPGLFDMSGNVDEWDDSCNGQTGVNDACRVRGGSIDSDANGLRCDDSNNVNRDAAANWLGFRCCGSSL
jgi:formylglycine-generating enzyme required for sulfatase activity